MAAFAGGVLLASWGLPHFVEPAYRAEAELALGLPPPRQRFDPDQGVLRPGPIPTPRDREWVLFQERERLLGPDLRAALARELGSAADRLGPLRVEPARSADGSRLRLSLESADPALAAHALGRLLALAEASAPAPLPGPDPAEELGQALDAAKAALALAERTQKELEAGGSLALLAERAAASRREREAAAVALARNEAELQARRASLAALERQLAGLPELILVADTRDLANPPPDLPNLEERLRALRAEEADLLGRYPADSDPVQEVRRRLQAAEASLERLLTPARTQRVRNPVRAGVEERLLLERAEVPALEARVIEGSRRLAGIAAELAGCEGRHAALEPKVEELRQERTNRIQEVRRLERLRAALEQSPFGHSLRYTVLESPHKPLYPFRPDRGRILLLGLLLALVGAPGLAIVIDRVSATGGRTRREGGS